MTRPEHFEKTLQGKTTGLWILQNSHGTRLSLTNYGCRIVELLMKGKDGVERSVVVGYDSIDQYLATTEEYHGAVVGRFANRIANGSFAIDGHTYRLNVNNAPNHLHGGPEGFHKKVWDVLETSTDSVTFRYQSADGEEGFPGNLTVTVRYSLSNLNELSIQYRATTDRDTVLNLTNHAYFNLNGQGSGPVLDHLVQIDADQFTPVSEKLIPTGVLASVEGTPFDFREPRTIGERINEQDGQLMIGNGYDHNYVLKNGGTLAMAARVECPESGIVLETLTDQPGMQFYTTNSLHGGYSLEQPVPPAFRTAFCLETQHYPDAPNQPHFPSTCLRPGEEFSSQTVYRFLLA
jgi:aldose 1-epimerase